MNLMKSTQRNANTTCDLVILLLIELLCMAKLSPSVKRCILVMSNDNANTLMIVAMFVCSSAIHFNSHNCTSRNVLFNDALNTFYLRLYGVRHMVKDHSDSEKGNPQTG